MDSKKLEILMTAVDLGSFTKTSEVVGYTQSGLTHMINALERDVGFPLLQRISPCNTTFPLFKIVISLQNSSIVPI